MRLIQPLAPCGNEVVDYDRRHLALYAALLDAADVGEDWKSTASNLMGLRSDETGAEECWRSHLERARWIVGEGLASAVDTFGRRPVRLAD